MTRGEAEQSGNGYIKEKQAFFDLSAETEGQLTSREMSVPSGKYRVTLYCDDGGWGDAYAYAYSYGNAVLLKSEEVQCSSSERNKSFYLIADHSIADLQIRLNLEASAVTIDRTVIERIDRTGYFVFLYLTLDGIAFVLWTFLRYLWKKQQSDEQCIAWAIIGVGFFIAIAPVLGTGILSGTDLDFHLWRIEAVKEGLSDGDLIPRIYTNLLNDYGYASGVLYGDSFLYLPALLRMAGMTVSGAYRVFMITMTAFTIGIGYHVFDRISDSRCIGAVCSVLYALTAPRIMELYENAGLGSACAIMFIPLVFGSLWLLWQGGEENGAQARRWLVVGATGLIQSHIIMTFVTALLAAGMILLGFRHYLKKDRFLILLQSAGWILLLNASFLIPFADYYLTTKMKVNTLDGFAMMQVYGANMQQLLQCHRFGDLSWVYLTLLGVSVLSMILLYVMYRIWLGIKREHAAGFENLALIGCSVSLLLCTRYFPWDYLSKRISLVNGVAKSIQFPFRFRNVMLSLLVILVCMMLKNVYRKSQAACFGMGVVLFAAAVGGSFQIQDVIDDQLERRIYIEETGIRTGLRFQIGAGAEYLPSGVTADFENTQIIDDQQVVEHVERIHDRFCMDVDNQNGEESVVELPLLYYKGYTAYDADTKDRFEVGTGTNGRVCVKVSSGYQGTIKLKFQDAWYWNAAEIITLLAWICAAVLAAKRHGFDERLKKWGNKGLTWKKQVRKNNTK